MEWGNLSGLWGSCNKDHKLFTINLKVLGVEGTAFKARVQEVSNFMMEMRVWHVFDISTYSEMKKESTRYTLYAIFPRQPGIRLRVTECETPTITKGCMIRGNVRKRYLYD